MAAYRLQNAISKLVLGNGTVYNFIDYIGDMHLTGGIARYTLDRGYFANNIMMNYNGGAEGRYGYGNSDYSAENGKEKIEGTDGVVLDKGSGQLKSAALYQDRIGDYYRTDGTERNSERDFTTVEEFSLLGELIRNENLSDNVKIDTFKNRYSTEGEDIKFIPRSVSSINIGDENVSTTKNVVYSDLFGQRKPLNTTSKRARELNLQENDNILDSQGLLTDEHDEKYRNRHPLTPTYQGDPTIARLGRKLFTITEKGEAERDRLSMHIKTNSFIYNAMRALPKYYKSDSAIGLDDFYGEEYVKRDLEGEIQPATIDNYEGLFKYYTDKREEYTKKSPYWYGRSYAIETNAQAEFYEIEDGKKARKVAVSRDYVQGTFRSNSPIDKRNGTYVYYEEPDGTAPVTEGKKDDAPESFTPQISDFSNSSRLMKMTNNLFRSGDIKSLINRFHTDTIDNDEFIISAYDKETGMSRGRNLRRANGARDKKTGFDNPYCRVWTAHHQYSKLRDRIRPFMEGDTFMSIKELQSNLGKLRPNNGAQRLSDYSTLQDNGYVKITPYHESGQLAGGENSLKRYMFSIENLAWKDFATRDRLSREQIGPFGGRIMWFPPYNLKFTENVNTQWKDNDFIGRGEKIYTYVNTDRSGTLNFSLLIDHPSIINKAVTMGESGIEEEDILRFFAGCGTLDVTDIEQEPQPEQEVYGEDDNVDDTTPRLKPDRQYVDIQFVVFYPNNFSAKKYYGNMDEAIKRLDEYEMYGGEAFREMDIAWERQKLAENNYDNESIYGLNLGEWDDDIKTRIATLLPIYDIDEILPYAQFKNLNKYYNGENNDSIFEYDRRDYELDGIIVEGFASDHGYPEANQTLAEDRANTMAMLAKHLCGNIDNEKIRFGECYEIPIKKPGIADDVNDLDAKIVRSSLITFRLKLRDDVSPENLDGEYEGPNYRLLALDDTTIELGADIAPTYSIDIVTVNEEPKELVTMFHGTNENPYYTYQNEFMYFQQLKASDEFAYKNIVKKVKFFDPAFHSLTPEGFNSRLNFLHQCTRQGPTIGSHAGEENNDKSTMSRMAGNLSFGTAPYCILRIGDFFYSKICIDSMSIDYDTGGGVQWDLNPEGAGVQPMMANISLNFHFIGGQDIEGPVAQLQNAISYNYYANSSIYTPGTQDSIPTYKTEDIQ